MELLRQQLLKLAGDDDLWSDPSEEPGRIARMRAGMQTYLPASAADWDARYPGLAATRPDLYRPWASCESLLWFVARSNNDNCYMYFYRDDTTDEDEGPRLHVLKMRLHPPDTAEERDAFANPTLMVELSVPELAMFDAEIKIPSDTSKPWEIDMKSQRRMAAELASSRPPMYLVSDADGRYICQRLGGRDVSIQYNYVQWANSKEDPRIEYVILVGLALDGTDDVVREVVREEGGWGISHAMSRV